jgi:[acyl-carrier-protein] S-malonyltransferase
MAKTALLFPGQGAPAARWADAVRELRPDLIELGSELLGDDPFERLGESTEYDQVAICCASLLAYERLEGEDADYHAGHSLGEIPALVCAGALTDEEGVRVVAARGQAMAEALVCAGAFREGEGVRAAATPAGCSRSGPTRTRCAGRRASTS